MGEEHIRYQDQVKVVLALAGAGNANGGERTYKDCEILHFARTDK
jgi:hypothetical protein